LSNAFFAGTIERPHHIANAIAKFGERGYEILLKGTKSSLPNIRYYSARYLGATGFESAKTILEEMMSIDNEKTTFGGLVSTAARKSLKTLSKILEDKEK
ncbi:MAG TPA: HEAT repeat domain-containing protein, partial [Pyrinomonadaceae bacterium]|nr:HEAT repeat domain-containing protein [Pyrinomonadaceae bacterium]